MDVKEQLKPFKPIVEMNSMELIREQYFQNLIYNIGDWVKDVKTEITGEVVKRGTNYVTLVQEDFTLHKVWLEDAQSMEKQHKKLPEAVNFLKNRNLWEKLQREGRKNKPLFSLKENFKNFLIIEADYQSLANLKHSRFKYILAIKF